MTRIGIVSIPQDPSSMKLDSFERAYEMLGLNTGNLLFVNAAFDLAGEKIRLKFYFDPDEVNEAVDVVVIPAANWLNPKYDFDYLATRIEKLKVPVVVIGLGAQSPMMSESIELQDGTIRFAHAIANQSTSISVRGKYTEKILKKLGIKNIKVTGCPSLYKDFRNFTPSRNDEFDITSCLLHSTRYSAEHRSFLKSNDLNLNIFRFAYSHGLELVYQSEPEEMSMLLDGYTKPKALSEELRTNLLEIYGASDWSALSTYICDKGATYIDINKWSQAVTNHCFVFGTRLHGTIMALNSGVPAMLACHDSRTTELAKFAEIPHVDATKFTLSERNLQAAYESLNLSRYYRRRKVLRNKYDKFLAENGLSMTS